MVGSHLQSSSPRENEKKGANSHKTCIGTLICGRPLPIYRHLVRGFFIKTLTIISIFTKIYRPYVFDPLGPYISLVSNDGYDMAYKPIILSCILFMFIEMIYSLSFLCDVCNEVHEHVQSLSKL